MEQQDQADNFRNLIIGKLAKENSTEVKMEASQIAKDLVKLEGFIKKMSKFSNSQQDFPFFSSLVRSSLIKNYEFLKLVYLEDKFDSYFFITSFLRGIVEDIIVLESIHSLSDEKREKLLRGIQLLEINERASKQWDFFQKYRPFQPVIDKAIHIEEAVQDVQNIWREIGWASFETKPRKTMPPIIQLAKKLAPGVLDLLYEFIYRLSSSTVHFSPQTMLKMGWGRIDDKNNFSGTISVKHMANYYKAFSQIYGTLLFSFYFEFFSEEVAATATEQKIIVSMRKSILKEMRWPEMITFEEMNLPVPKAYHDQILTYGIIHQAIIEVLQVGFVKNNYQNFLDKIRA